MMTIGTTQTVPLGPRTDKLPYTSPKLTDFGGLAELTATGSVPGEEGGLNPFGADQPPVEP